MPRVLHLRTVTGHGGGPEKTLLASPRFIGQDYELRLAYFRPAIDPLYDMPDRALRAGAVLVDLPEQGPIDPRAITRLIKEIRAFRPDLLHAHDYKTNWLSIWLGKVFRIPVMTTAHGYVTVGGRLNLYYRLDRWALRRMQRVVVVSEDLLKGMVAGGVSPSRCVLIENAIDAVENRRTVSVADAKQELGIDASTFLVGAVGRLAPEKGFDHLIRAVDQLIETGHKVRLVIVGEGPERDRLQKLIVDLGSQDAVTLAGYRSDLPGLYAAMDLFVLSSLREGLPNVVLEAMAFEVPVVATRIAGIPRLITDGQNGKLIAPGNQGELVEAIGSLLADPVQRTRMATAARATVEDRYSFEARMSKIRALYDEVLGLSSIKNPSPAGQECLA